MGVGQRVVVPSTSADFNNYIYEQIIVGGYGPGGTNTGYTVTFNGVTMLLSSGMNFDMDVKSVEVGNPNVFLAGYLITFDFPVYLGNSWSTDYLGRPIIQSNTGGVFAQSGNTQYAYYK
jgi:hypothetical protein